MLEARQRGVRVRLNGCVLGVTGVDYGSVLGAVEGGIGVGEMQGRGSGQGLGQGQGKGHGQEGDDLRGQGEGALSPSDTLVVDKVRLVQLVGL